jgi:phosphoglycerate dehydrogenase-like enzyme
VGGNVYDDAAMKRLQALVMPHPVGHLNEERTWLDRECARNHDVTLLDRTGDIPAQMAGIDAVVDYGGNITRDELDVASEAGISFVQMVTNGLDHCEVDYALAKGFTVCHCPSNLSSESLAQTAMMFILMLAGRYKENAELFAQGVLYRPRSYGIVGKSLLIVGFGASGVELARRARACGMEIWANDIRDISADERREIPLARVGGPGDLAGMVAEADVVSVHLHLTDATRHVISRDLIASMQPSAWVINVARGELIDEDALYQALLGGKLGGAAIDVFGVEPPPVEHPVFQLPNVVATPHTAGGSEVTMMNRAVFCAENLDRLAHDEEPLGQVTGPLVKT